MHRITVPPDAPEAMVREAVDAVRAGRVVVLPTETVYGFAIAPDRPAAIDRVRELKRRPDERRFTHHVASRDAVQALGARVPRGADRLLLRYWPGPLTAVLPAATGTVGVRWPSQPFTERVIRGCGTSLYLSSVNVSGEPSLAGPDAIASRFGAECEYLFDAGPPSLGQDSTVVDCSAPRLRVLREGILTEREVLETAAELVLFVCTGNTCRSPLAEALARDLVGQALGVSPELVLAHGLWLSSAGTAAGDGGTASEASRAVARESGLDLDAHRTRALTAALVARAARVLCLSDSHLAAVLAIAPDAATKCERLDRSRSLSDPFGGDLAEYRRTRDDIRRALDARVPELVAMCRRAG